MLLGGKMRAHFVARNGAPIHSNFLAKELMVLAILMMSAVAGAQQQPADLREIQTEPKRTPLRELTAEAERNNPAIQAAIHGYEAAQETPKASGALPDTEVTVQHFSVGSPRPFAGYTNSEFAYLGIGASQQIPYPGKRRLRAEVASHEADSVQADAESVRRDVLEKVKATYFRLAYLQQTLSILQRNETLLADVAQIAESRYRVGQGNQQEVLRAQLQRTKILQEITMHHREVGQLQAQLKQVLDRAQDSLDIVPEPNVQRALPYSSTELLEFAKKENPEIRSREAMLKRSDSQVELVHKEFRPDFNVQYMYQNTDRKFRDYYMASFSLNLPNRSRRQAELAQALAKQSQEKQQLQAEIQKQLAEIQERYVFAQTSAEQLNIYKEGLIPQANATYQAALAAYQSNRQDFQTLLSSFLDVLNLEIDYQRELADRESALTRIETLTGVTLQ
jgi:cobalt-zinc-cadmium efflux system outer membrane protein